MTKIRDRKFFEQSAEELAPQLLGKIICRKIRDEKGEFTVRVRIIETEAYGEKDTACHNADQQREAGGKLYVHPTYGWNFFSVVANREDVGEDVLIGGVDCYDTPGRVADYALGIDKGLDGEDLVTSKEIWIEDDEVEVEYKEEKRINIDYASEKDKNKLWRFRVTKLTYNAEKDARNHSSGRKL
jgi:3-methyladenine DNA glycosylase Mpg